MRSIVLSVVLVSLTACDSNSVEPTDSQQSASLPASPFDGSDYGTDEAKMLAHGERLSAVLLCTGCHTETLTGQNWGDIDSEFDGLWASNLTQVLPQMSDEQLRTLLTRGVHPTRGDMYIMPSKLYQHVAAADLDALVAYLRTLEPTGEASPLPQFRPEAQALIEAGELKTSAEDVAIHANSLPPDLGAAHARGREIATVTCAECHGSSLDGSDGFAPDLDIAGMYSPDQLRQLLTTGEGLEGRELGLMALMGREHFSFFTEQERSAVVTYILARAEANTTP